MKCDNFFYNVAEKSSIPIADFLCGSKICFKYAWKEYQEIVIYFYDRDKYVKTQAGGNTIPTHPGLVIHLLCAQVTCHLCDLGWIVCYPHSLAMLTTIQ